jgi:hypothetical protein
MSPEREGEKKRREVIPKEIVENVFVSAMPSYLKSRVIRHIVD